LYNISKVATGGRNSTFTEDYRASMGQRLSGSNNPFWGKTHSPEAINKLSDHFKGANSVTAQQYSVTNTLTNITQVFGTLLEAAAFVGVHRNSVYRAIANNSLIKGIWRFEKVGDKLVKRSGISLYITDLSSNTTLTVDSFHAAASHTGVSLDRVRRAVSKGRIIDNRWVIKRLDK